MFEIPYTILVYLAILFEYLYRYFGLEPLFTRLEVNMLSITNTYSIREAQRDLGYRPTHNHELTEVIRYYKIAETNNNRKGKKKGLVSSIVSERKHFNAVLLNGISFILFALLLFLFWIS